MDCIVRPSCWAFDCFQNTSLEMLSQEWEGYWGAPVAHLQPNIRFTFISPTTGQNSIKVLNNTVWVSLTSEHVVLVLIMHAMFFFWRGKNYNGGVILTPDPTHPFCYQIFDKFDKDLRALTKNLIDSGLFHIACIDNRHPLSCEGANLNQKKQDGQSSSGWRPLISFQPPRLVIIWQTEKAHFGMLWSSSVLPDKIQLNLPKKLIQKQFVCPSAVTTNSSDLVVDGSPKNQRNTQDRYAGLESLVKKGVRGAVSARG